MPATSETLKPTVQAPDVESTDSALVTAQERHRSIDRQEEIAYALRLRSLALWAMVLWPAFFPIDWMQVTYVEDGSLGWFALWRFGYMPALFGVAWLLRHPPYPSRQVLQFLDALISVLACAALCMICIEAGGIRSHYSAGLIAVLAARGLFLPLNWKRSLLINGAACATYPVILLGGALFSDRLADQLRDPSSVGVFVFYLALIATVALLAVAGGHTVWALRRQVFQARSIGRYRLKEPIGAGGMGEVWAAYHTNLKRDVALKILRPDGGKASSAVRRFEREVEATSKLTHPNTVRIFDYGVTPDGLWYYAMELLEGGTLRELVHAEGAQQPKRAVHIVSQAARALAEAHDKGIVHRDVKPANLFLTQAGGEPDFVKVLDFGIAGLTAVDEKSTLTSTGAVPGTPAYMAPEIVAGSRGDPRADVYALGAVLYFLLVGDSPFETTNWAAAMLAHVHTAPKRPSERIDTPIPNALEDIVMKCLAKDPDERYANGAELAAALVECDLEVEA